jgi:hypothetical protein
VRLAIHQCQWYHVNLLTTNANKKSHEAHVEYHHHRAEFCPLAAHCKQCLLADTTAHVAQTCFPQSLHAKGLFSTAPPISISISKSISSFSPCRGASQSSQRGRCDAVWLSCIGGENMGGWTGGAGSCFQKECSVDFCGFEAVRRAC